MKLRGECPNKLLIPKIKIQFSNKNTIDSKIQ